MCALPVLFAVDSSVFKYGETILQNYSKSILNVTTNFISVHNIQTELNVLDKLVFLKKHHL